MMTKRELLWKGGIAATALALGVGFERGLRVTRKRVPWKIRERRRLVHLTDLHFGWSTPPPHLEQALDLTRAFAPHLVVLTGDYVNHTLTHVDRLESFVSRLPGPVFATLGNHDYWTDAPAIARRLERAGARVLFNESLRVEDIHLVAVDDSRTEHHDIPKAFAKTPAGEDLLVLTHSPQIGAELAEQPGTKLVLAGHTHGGQIALPVVTRSLARLKDLRHIAGPHVLGEALLYVNAGLGHARRGMRYGASAQPELLVVDLVPDV